MINSNDNMPFQVLEFVCVRVTEVYATTVLNITF